MKAHSAKVWTEAELVRDNLDFRFALKWPLPEAMSVWYWEMDREMGTVTEPFVARPMRSATSICEDPNHEVPLPFGLKYHKLGTLLPFITPETDSLRVRGMARSRVYGFEINWELPWPQIVAAFDAWGKKQHTYRIPQSWWPETPADPDEADELTPPSTKLGRKDGCQAWLGELRAYRIKSAGLTRNEGLALLRQMGVLGKDVKKSSANWSAEERRSRKRILLYRNVIEMLPAEAQSRVPPNSELAWRLLDYFAKPSVDRRGSSGDFSIPRRAFENVVSGPVARRIMKKAGSPQSG